VRLRVRSGLVALLVIGLVLGITSAAVAAPAWKNVRPTAKFLKYSEHAAAYGLDVWYPSRLPAGYKVSSVKVGMSFGYPSCDVVFKKGRQRIELSQDALSTEDAEGLDSPYYDEEVAWGSQRGFRRGGDVSWWGRHNSGTERAVLSGSGTTQSQVRSISKYMKKIQSPSTWVGDCYQWTPKGNARLKGNTTLVIHSVDSDDQLTCIASNAKTRFLFQRTEDKYSPGDHGTNVGEPIRVTRNRFFALARAHTFAGRAQMFVSATWVWKRNSHHKWYRYVTSVSGTYYEQ